MDFELGIIRENVKPDDLSLFARVVRCTGWTRATRNDEKEQDLLSFVHIQDNDRVSLAN